MAKLYFMNREFSGFSWTVSEMLEDMNFRASLIFDDSWFFLHYCFFGHDCICSETSGAVQTHLYNLASVLYRDFETITGDEPKKEKKFLRVIAELVAIAEYSSEFVICLWAYGDETTQDFLQERIALLPTQEQITQFLELPHMTRHDRERLMYRYSDPKTSLKRYRNELAAFNRRRKLAIKNAQRSKAQ